MEGNVHDFQVGKAARTGHRFLLRASETGGLGRLVFAKSKLGCEQKWVSRSSWEKEGGASSKAR